MSAFSFVVGEGARERAPCPLFHTLTPNPLCEGRAGAPLLPPSPHLSRLFRSNVRGLLSAAAPWN